MESHFDSLGNNLFICWFCMSLSRLENEQKEKCLKDVRWMQKVLKEQADEENRRKKELDFVFAEEAERMWNKQQEIWDRYRFFFYEIVFLLIFSFFCFPPFFLWKLNLSSFLHVNVFLFKLCIQIIIVTTFKTEKKPLILYSVTIWNIVFCQICNPNILYHRIVYSLTRYINIICNQASRLKEGMLYFNWFLIDCTS